MSFRHFPLNFSSSSRPGQPAQLTLLVLFLTAAIVLKLWLVSGQHLTALGGAMHDDRLFLTLAKSILDGRWLGPYNNLTLAKGPFYPMWIAAVSGLGIPLLLAQHLLYGIACLVAVIALRPVVSTPLPLFLIFIFLLFNPLSFTSGVMTQVIREGIYPALTLLVIASATGFLLRMDRAITGQIPWAAGLGLSLSAFWLTREEGVWIVPSLLVFALCGAAGIISGGRDRTRRLFIILIPFIIWALCVTGICLLNRAHYGIFATTELKSRDLLGAYGSLARVIPEHWEPTVPVPQEVRLRIYPVSGAFSELKPYLEGDMGKAWSSRYRAIREFAEKDPEFAKKVRAYLSGDPSGVWDRAMQIDDEIQGGFFIWAFRDAAASAGHYGSAPSAMAYYRKIADEVNNACTAGALRCGPVRSSLMPPLRLHSLSPFLKTMGYSAFCLARFDGFDVIPEPSRGEENLLQLFRDMTYERLSPSEYRIRGWVVSPSSGIVMTLRTTGGNPVRNVPLVPAPDVRESLVAGGRDLTASATARFDVNGDLVSPAGMFRSTWRLTVESDGTVIGNVPLDGSVRQIDRDGLMLSIESAGAVNGPSADDAMKLRWLDRIARIYRFLLPAGFVSSLALFLFGTFKAMKRRHLTLTWIVSGALILAVLVRLAILSLIHVTSFPAIIPQYLSPVYPPLILFIVVSLTGGAAMMRHGDIPGRGGMI